MNSVFQLARAANQNSDFQGLVCGGQVEGMLAFQREKVNEWLCDDE